MRASERPLKIFDGAKEDFPIWVERLEARVSNIGQAASRVLQRTGEFKDMKYDPSHTMILANIGKDASIKAMETPIAKRLVTEFGTSGVQSSKKKENIEKKEEKEEDEADSFAKRVEEDKKIRADQVKALFNLYSQKIYSTILDAVSDSVWRAAKNKGLKKGDGVRAYEILKGIYETGGKETLMRNFTAFVNLTEENAGTLTNYTYKFNELSGYLASVDAQVPDTLAMCLYLKGLSSKHATVIGRIQDESRTITYTLQQVVDRIHHNEENRFQQQETAAAANQQQGNTDSNLVYDPTKQYYCFNCKSKHIGGERKCRQPCRVCNSSQHVRFNCPERKNRGRNNQQRQRGGRGRGRNAQGNRGGNDASGNNGDRNNGNQEQKEHGGAAYESYGINFAGTAFAAMAAGNSSAVLLDSGASYHYFKPGTPVTNTRKVGSHSINTASSDLKYDTVADMPAKKLKGVKLVEGISANLVSLSTLVDDRNAVYVLGKAGAWEIPEQNLPKILAQNGNPKKIATRQGRLYQYTDTACHTHEKHPNLLYDLHQKLGHRSITAIINGLRNGAIKGYDKYKFTAKRLKTLRESLPSCPICAESKSTKSHSEKKRMGTGRTSHKIGQSFQADICYPVKPVTPKEDGFLTVVDQATGFVLDAGILGKDSTPQRLHALLKTVAQQLPTSNTFAIRRTVLADDCAELRSAEAKKLIQETGFELVNGAGYHRNSVSSVDRAMRTIVEMTRANMAGAPGASRTLHPYARKLAVMQHNMTPKKGKGWKSPHELFYGEQPTVSRLHKFYCDAYVKLENGPERTKSERYTPVAKLGKYLGVPKDGRGHLILIDGKVIVREDVWFKENLPKDHVIQPIPSHDTEIKQQSGGADYGNEVTSDEQKHAPVTAVKKNVNFAPIETAKRPTAKINEGNILKGTRGNRGVPPLRYGGYGGYAGTMHEAPTEWTLHKYKDRAEWLKAEQTEYAKLGEKKVLTPIKSNGTEKPMRLLNQYKYKKDADGKMIKRKVRTCCDGRSQKRNGFEGKTFAPVIQGAIMMMCLALGVEADLIRIQFDWVGAFLNAENDRVEYARPPPRYPMPEGCDLLRIDKALYGQLQSAACWHKHMAQGLLEDGFVESPTAKCLYVRPEMNGEPASIIFIHVDDGCIITTNKAAANRVLRSLNAKNELESEEMGWYIGLKVEEKEDGGIRISGPAYIDEMLAKYGMTDCNPKLLPADPNVVLKKNDGERFTCPYQEAVGSLNYASCKFRPDITYQVNKLASYCSNPSKTHWTAVKHLLAYLKGTKDKGVCIKKTTEKGTTLLQAVRNCKLEVYTDSDYAMDADTRKSTSGFTIQLNGNLVYWSSKKQPVIAQSTAEAETIAGCDGTKYAEFIRKALHEIEMILCGKSKAMNKGEKNSHVTHWKSKATHPITVFTDNKAAELVANSGDFTKRMKHIDVRYYYQAEQVAKGIVTVQHVPGAENPADLFTKPVKLPVFRKLVSLLVQ